MEVVAILIVGTAFVAVCHKALNMPRPEPWAWGAVNDNIWKVDQQMIVTKPEEQSSSTELVRAVDPTTHGIIPIDWPRVIQVTIKNGHMNQLVGEVPVHESQELVLARLINQAQERASWLNAHQVR